MDVLIEDNSLLEKYNAIWDKGSADIRKEFDSKPVFNRNFLKTKIKCHDDKVSDLNNKKILKVDSNHTF